MSALTVVFRTRSEIEANVVQGLLESHGVESVRTAGAPPGMFPFTVSTPICLPMSCASGFCARSIRSPNPRCSRMI